MATENERRTFPMPKGMFDVAIEHWLAAIREAYALVGAAGLPSSTFIYHDHDPHLNAWLIERGRNDLVYGISVFKLVA